MICTQALQVPNLKCCVSYAVPLIFLKQTGPASPQTEHIASLLLHFMVEDFSQAEQVCLLYAPMPRTACIQSILSSDPRRFVLRLDTHITKCVQRSMWCPILCARTLRHLCWQLPGLAAWRSAQRFWLPARQLTSPIKCVLKVVVCSWYCWLLVYLWCSAFQCSLTGADSETKQHTTHAEAMTPFLGKDHVDAVQP